MTGKPLSKDVTDQISKLSHLPRKVIAVRLGIGLSTVQKYLKQVKEHQ